MERMDIFLISLTDRYSEYLIPTTLRRHNRSTRFLSFTRIPFLNAETQLRCQLSAPEAFRQTCTRTLCKSRLLSTSQAPKHQHHPEATYEMYLNFFDRITKLKSCFLMPWYTICLIYCTWSYSIILSNRNTLLESQSQWSVRPVSIFKIHDLYLLFWMLSGFLIAAHHQQCPAKKSVYSLINPSIFLANNAKMQNPVDRCLEEKVVFHIIIL